MNKFSMEVIKRNGNKEIVKFDKITARISNLCSKDDLKKADPIVIAQKTIMQIYNGITTEELDNESAKVCASMSTLHPQYSIIGGKICISNLHKKTDKSFVNTMNILYNKTDLDGNHTPVVTKKFIDIVNNNSEQLENIIDHSKDLNYNYFGFKTLEKLYLMKINNKIVERPQHMILRVAIGIHGDNLNKIKETYNYMSSGYFTHASPTLFNAGTKYPQLSSCFLMDTIDDLEGIYETIKQSALISKRAGGIGISISDIRSNGSLIRGTNGPSSGIKQMLQVYNATARYVNQGGRRNGSIAVYLEPWHPDIFEFLELRKNTGSELDRARDLFLALWIPDLFMKRVENDEMWTMMCPDRCKGLTTTFGEEFEKKYIQYENNLIFDKKYKIKARDLWRKILETQMETGLPYIGFKDNVNRKTNHNNLGTIKCSNLCIEICEFSSPDETAVCNLASIALNKFVEPIKTDNFKDVRIYTKTTCNYCKLAKSLLLKNNIIYNEVNLDNDNERKNFFKRMNMHNKTDEEIKTVPQIFIDGKNIGSYDSLSKLLKPTYNFKKLEKIVSIITENLNKIIDINFYPTIQGKRSNLKNRPIGIGVQGLADTYNLMRFPFESNEAFELNKLIFETIYYSACKKSMELSKERTKLILKFNDLWENNTPNIPDLYDHNFKSNNKNIYDLYHSIKPLLSEVIRKSHLGSYSTFIGSNFSKGKLQFDLWNLKLTDNRYDWSSLKNNIIKYGTRNSLLTALMPTASTSQLLGNNECFEPFTNNIYKRKTLAGDFTVINKYLIEDLNNLNMWNPTMKDLIIYNDGSIQNINGIPSEIKKLYKTVWEISQKYVVDQAIARGPFVDQSMSMNIYMANPEFNKLTSCHFASWKGGLKTGIYYLRSRPAKKAAKFGVNMDNINQSLINHDDDHECFSCGS
jgi:ribonucleoside-diphosphate reductase alpha subunit